MSMRDRACREQLRAQRKNALKRYEKHRRRNLLAQHGELPFVIVLDHLKAGFNVPKIFRSAEAFGAREVHLIGIGPFDPAPAKGAFKNVPARFHENFESCYHSLLEQGYTLYALEPGCGAELGSVGLAQKSAFIFGHEEHGLSFERESYPQVQCLGIAQFGKVQSLNVSVAASVVMYEYGRQYGSGEAISGANEAE
jgi:tRNA G18 (ribose-2'-O)-methylase SpoU